MPSSKYRVVDAQKYHLAQFSMREGLDVGLLAQKKVLLKGREPIACLIASVEANYLRIRCMKFLPGVSRLKAISLMLIPLELVHKLLHVEHFFLIVSEMDRRGLFLLRQLGFRAVALNRSYCRSGADAIRMERSIPFVAHQLQSA